jgi:hypothetical protein
MMKISQTRMRNKERLTRERRQKMGLNQAGHEDNTDLLSINSKDDDGLKDKEKLDEARKIEQ